MTVGSIKAVIALDAGVDRDVLQAALPSSPEFQVVRIAPNLDDGRGIAGDTQSNLLVVACGGYSDKALLFIKDAVKERPERPVVVLCEGAPNGFVSRVFEAGADDIVVLPDMQPSLNGTLEKEVLFALQKTVARRHSFALDKRAGDLICVVGPKGGIGKTLTSVNLGASLATRGERVVIVDLDLQFGDVGLALGLQPDKTIYDLATSGGSIDAEKVEAYLAPHDSGLRVLIAPRRPDHAGAIGTEFLVDLYRTLRLTYDYVIVDTPPGFSPEVIASIDSSSHVCMLGMLDALALKNTKLGLETLELMGYDSTRVRIVLNRADSDVGVRSQDVVQIIGRTPDVLIPSQREIARSINSGKPIAVSQPRSDAARGFGALAEIYRAERGGPATAPAQKPKRRRRLIFGRRSK